MMKKNRPVVCKDGFKMSVQAGQSNYPNPAESKQPLREVRWHGAKLLTIRYEYVCEKSILGIPLKIQPLTVIKCN